MSGERVEFVTDESGTVVLASDRATLLAACPEHANVIERDIGDVEPNWPVWLTVDCAWVVAGASRMVVRAELQPAWWVEAHGGKFTKRTV